MSEVVGGSTLSSQWRTDQHIQWLSSADIKESDWEYALELVGRESSWRPTALNQSSGACGLAQALPCNKIKGDWQDPIVALKWMDVYVHNRYGGWQRALNFHMVHNWY